MGKDLEITDQIKSYIENLSKELHPVQKQIIAYNENLGEIKKMQIAVSQCHFLEFITINKAIDKQLFQPNLQKKRPPRDSPKLKGPSPRRKRPDRKRLRTIKKK